MNYFKGLVTATKKAGESNRLVGVCWLFWILSIILIISNILLWFDLRLFIGTMLWIIITYVMGYLIIKKAQ